MPSQRAIHPLSIKDHYKGNKQVRNSFQSHTDTHEHQRVEGGFSRSHVKSLTRAWKPETCLVTFTVKPHWWRLSPSKVVITHGALSMVALPGTPMDTARPVESWTHSWLHWGIVWEPQASFTALCYLWFFRLGTLTTILVGISIIVMNTMTKKKLEREELNWLTLPHHSLSRKEIKTGTQVGRTWMQELRLKPQQTTNL